LRRTSRLVLLAGVFLAALTFIVVILLLQNPTQTQNGGPAATSSTRPVVVAAADIPLGSTIQASMLSTTTVPVSVAEPGAFQDPSQVIGQFNTVAITAGAQVTTAMFAAGGAAQHPDPGPGKRAFALTFDATKDVGNLVRVGDFVDVLISEQITVVQRNPDGTVATIPGLENALTVKMPLLLENIQVIGIIEQAPATAQGGQPAASSGPALDQRLLVLAVTPQQSEVLLFARQADKGTIDVVYRAAQDAATVTTEGVILKTLIDKYGVLPPNVVITSVP
jgi:pilus assembly protein CpaB